jgi:polygalacturonase
LQDRQNRVDDTPQIMEAYKQCGKDGTIILREGTYHIRQVMDMSDLRNCSIEIHGTLIWSDDNLSYWRQSSFSVTYAQRSTAWRIGGRDITLRGFGKALFNGNGQTWIDLARGQANLQGRPITLTVWRGTNVLIDGITWRMAQFWHTFVAYSQNVTMTNLDMSTYSQNSQSSQNTDGTNTWNSRDIFIANWTVKCGDVSRTNRSPGWFKPLTGS